MTRAKLDVVDRLDIQDLFARYCFLIDENRGDEWAALFVRDAVFDVPGLARLEGREQIRTMVDMVSAQSRGNWRHQLTNIVAEPGHGLDATYRIPEANGSCGDGEPAPAPQGEGDE